jgi:hypothetical protein
MDLTGHGLRCRECSARAELAIYKSGNADNRMSEHLTRHELDRVVIDSRKQILVGVGALILAVAAYLFALGVGGVMYMMGGCVAFGIGAIARGLYRGQMAKAAIRQAPDARLIKG